MDMSAEKKSVSRATVTAAKTSERSHKKKIHHTPDYSMLRRHSHRWYARAYRVVFYSLITVSTVNFLIEDTPYFQQCCSDYFNIFEGVISTCFFLEYCLKIRTARQRKAYAIFADDLHARIAFMFSSESFIDLVSFLPFFIEVASGIDPTRYELLRTLQLVRLLKMPVFWDSFRMVGRVLYYNGEILNMAFLVCFVMLMGCSVVLFYLRPPIEMDHIDNFGSILSCMYLAVLMLTGQGEPDGQLPWYTRVIVSVTALFAIAQFAIPASMLTWGFEQEAEHNISANDEREDKLVGHFLDGSFSEDVVLSSSSSDESDRIEEFEAYEKQVTGDSSSSSESGSDDSDDAIKEDTFTKYQGLTGFEMKRVRRLFRKLKGRDNSEDKKRICKATIYRIAQQDQKGSEAAAKSGKYLFENMCNRLDDYGVVVQNEVCLKQGSIDKLQFIHWLVYVKRTFPRYGDAIFVKVLDHLDDKVDEMEQDQKEGVSQASLSSKPMISSRRSANCLAGVLRRSRQKQIESNPIDNSDSFASLSSKQLFAFAEKMQTLETENARLRALKRDREEEIAMLKRQNATPS